MAKFKCYSVRLKTLVSISEKAYKATAFDGSTAIIPKSMTFGEDYDVSKSEAYWIASFVLEKSGLQYSCKKSAWFDERGNMLPSYRITRHSPEPKQALKENIIDELKKE